MLSALSIALQGLGFRLSPIALAVQGLIEQLEEEERLERAGGAKRGAGGRSAIASPRPRPAPLGPRVERHEDLQAYRDHWAFIEEVRAAQAARPAPAAVVTPRAAPPAPPAPPSPPAAAGPGAAALPAITMPASQRRSRDSVRPADVQALVTQGMDEDDALCLLLILAAAE